MGSAADVTSGEGDGGAVIVSGGKELLWVRESAEGCQVLSGNALATTTPR